MFAIIKLKDTGVPDLINPIPRETIEELITRVRPEKGEMIGIITNSINIPDNLFSNDNNSE